MPSEDPKAQAWQAKIGEFDAYIFIVAEYNHSITGALKNALDHAFTEWNNKRFSALGYGGLGAARAVEHLHGIGIKLQMALVSAAIHIAGGEFMRVFPAGQNEEIEVVEEALLPSLSEMMSQLEWWTDAIKSSRNAQNPAN